MDALSYGGRVTLDKSAYARFADGRLPAADAERFEQALLDGQLSVADPFALEILYSAQSAHDYRQISAELEGFDRLGADGETFTLARRAQAELAADPRVSHRVKPIDLLLAGIAHQHGVGILHYDHDYDVIRSHTTLRFSGVWIARRGSAG